MRPIVPKEFDNAAVRRVVHLATGTEIPFECVDDGLLLRLPASVEPDAIADAFQLER